MAGVIDAPVRRRSYSQLTTYQECPEKYRLKYIEHKREAPAVWSAGGTAFHQVAEWYLGGVLGDDPSDSIIVSAWQSALQLAVEEIVERDPGANPDPRTWRAAARGKETWTWWQANGLLMVQDFLDWYRSRRHMLVTFTDGDRRFLEARLEVELGGVPVVAIPDWLAVDEHGQLNIVDYKTGKPPKSSKQLGVYRAAVLAALGLDATWGLYYMARDARLLPVELSKWSPEGIGEDFARLDLGIKAEVFDPTPGDPCKFCPFREDGCRYYNPEVG